MLRFIFLAVLVAAFALAQDPGSQAGSSPSPSLNVNERYTIEAVDAKLPPKRKLSPELRQKLDALVGQKLNQDKLDEIAAAIKAEVKNHKVTQRIAKGDKPDHVKVTFELNRNAIDIVGDSDDFKLVYHSKNVWSFGGTVRIPVGDTGFGVLAGTLTDNDLHVERSSGIRGGFDKTAFNNRVKFQFVGESFRSQWNGTALQPALEPSIYRARQNFEPTVSLRPIASLTLTAGLSLARYQYQFPAARYLSAHAVISSLRFAREWENTSGEHHSLEAGYDLRAATRSLNSDMAFTRHQAGGRYAFKTGPHELMLEARAGRLTGAAPLYEAFVLGNTQTLRGWNRFDVAPLGGNRMAHGSAEYRYRGFRFLYDTGAVWGVTSTEAEQRHSAGVGYIDGGMTLVVAFPIRDGNVTPLVMLGYTF